MGSGQSGSRQVTRKPSNPVGTGPTGLNWKAKAITHDDELKYRQDWRNSQEAPIINP